MAVGAFAYLGIALIVGIAAAARGALADAVPTLVVLLLLGWLSSLGLTQLYKIVPFLAWLSRFGRRLGTGPVPRVQDLVNEAATLPLFAAYFAAVAIAAVATWFGIAVLIRSAMVLAIVATALLIRE